MRVIEQLVQHFWARGAITRDEALYLAGHGFVRESDLPGLVVGDREIDPHTYEPAGGDDGRPWEWPDREDEKARQAEQLEDELTGRGGRPGRGRGRPRRKALRRKQAALSALVARCFAGQTACPAVLALGNRVRPCGTWREAVRALTQRGGRRTGLTLLRGDPQACRELAACLDVGPLLNRDGGADTAVERWLRELIADRHASPERARRARRILGLPEVRDLMKVIWLQRRLGLLSG